MKKTLRLTLLLLLLVMGTAFAGEWQDLFSPNLEQWESVGEGLWSVTPEGYLMGQRDPRAPEFADSWFGQWQRKLNRSWLQTNFKIVLSQAWLYTKRDFHEYDLHLEWWLPPGGNSGISIHDPTRGRYTFGSESDLRKTPSQMGYEIQLANQYPDSYASGSIYMLQAARAGPLKENDWNVFEIEVRQDLIGVRLNSELVAEAAPLPDRPHRGPIGLQLHDAESVAMFRNLRIREATSTDSIPE